MAQLVVDRTDAIGGAVAHTVHTVARIGGGAAGLMVATSTFRSANWLSGFKAAAIVELLDGNGVVLAGGRTDPHHGWADATLIGVSEHTDTWTWQFDPAIADQAKNIAVVHIPDENYIGNIIAKLNQLSSFVQQSQQTSGKPLPQGGGDPDTTQNPTPYDPQTESGGGGAGEGGLDTETWALKGAPWSNYAAPAAQLKSGKATANPNNFQNHRPTQITIHAVDAQTGAAIQGAVYIGNAAVGHTDAPFTYTFNRRGILRVDPRSHQHSIDPAPLEAMTVRADGYNPMTVTYTVPADTGL